MRSVGGGHLVCLPDVHLGTAGTVVPDAHVIGEILGVGLPVLGVGLAANELNVVWALRVAVAGAILRASCVASNSLATICSHLGEVHGSFTCKRL